MSVEKQLSYTGTAKKSLGQNFLIDSNVASKIIRSLDIGPQDNILEIGPGQGALTHKICKLSSKLTVIEKDCKLAEYIHACQPQINVIVLDVLKFAWQRLLNGYAWKVIGNLPYNIASPLIWDFVGSGNFFQKAVFTIQKEVAQRIVSRPGSKQYGALSVWVQSFVSPKLLFSVGPQVFRPRPKVTSAVVSLEPLPQARRTVQAEKLADLLHLCFQQRRKQLGTILKSHWTPAIDKWLLAQGIDAQIRPEQLSPRQFQELALILF